MIGSYDIFVDGVSLGDELKKVAKIKYRDNMGLISDTLDIEMIDSALTAEDLFPNGAKVEAEFRTNTGKVLKTGALFVDTGEGDIIPGANAYVAGANSQPDQKPGMRTFIAYKKREVYLKTLLADILGKADLASVYRFLHDTGLPWDIKLKNVTIQNEKLGAVLQNYAEMFGCFLKVYDDKVIFANKLSFGADDTLKVVRPSEQSVRGLRYGINEHQYGEYAVSYYNPRTGKTTIDRKRKKSILLTESQTVRNIIANVADAGSAQALAMAVDGQRQVTLRFETEGDETAIAGAVWEFEEINKLSGKYVITSAEHTIRDNWTVNVSADNIF